MSKVIIPEKHYVGMVVRNGSKIPLGFITPWGDDKAAQKRMDTVDRWCNAGRSGSLPTTIIDNIPMLGFRMSGDIRRGMQGGQDKWRIEDPRGFELEITSENLSMLLSDTTLEKGEILDQCVWAREGGQNLLLTTSSEEYIEAVRMTQISASTASWKDVKIGNRVVLQNGLEGQYLGRMHAIRESSRSKESEIQNNIEPSTSPYHVILKPTTDRTWPAGAARELHFIASPKLSGVTDRTEITVAEAETVANDAIADPTCVVEYSGYLKVVLAAANTIKDASWTLLIEDCEDPGNVWTTRHYENKYLVRLKDGRVGRPSIDYNGKHTVTVLREDLLSTGIFEYKKYLHTDKSRYGRGNSSSRWVNETVEINLGEVASIHRLTVKLETKAGNIIRAHV
jgi:hypothetical protein